MAIHVPFKYFWLGLELPRANCQKIKGLLGMIEVVGELAKAIDELNEGFFD